MIIKRITCYFIVTFCLLPALVHAGGDFWPVKVEEKISNDESQKLKLLILDSSSGITHGCKQITVSLDYRRVPPWSWLPFIGTSHPTKAETAKAVEYLNNKFNQSAQAYFGYMGSGLFKVPSTDCTFISKGLKLLKIDIDNEFAVISFYDPL